MSTWRAVPGEREGSGPGPRLALVRSISVADRIIGGVKNACT
ncbi:hypothetical protein ACFT2C_04240 [Promicromonospora sp. NPDC057138]